MKIISDQDVSYYLKRLLFGVGIFLVLGIILFFSFYDNHEIRLKKDVLEYGSDIKIVDLVESIGNTKIDESMKISENTIKTEKFEVSFDNIDSLKLGTQKLKVMFSEKEIKDDSITIRIVDKEKPRIKLLIEEPKEMTLEAVKNKEFQDLFSVSDNATHEEKLKLDIALVEEEFTYGDVVNLKVVAKDQSNNTASKKIKIQIKEKKKPKKEEDNSNKNQSTSQNTQFGEQSISQQPQVQEPPSVPKPANKQFLFSQGYDMSSAPSACQSELVASGRAGACTPLQDGDGIYYGMQLTFY